MNTNIEQLKEKIDLTRDGLTTRIHACLDEYIGFAVDSDLSGLIISTIVEEVLAYHIDELAIHVNTVCFPTIEQKDVVLEGLHKIKTLYEQASRNSHSLV